MVSAGYDYCTEQPATHTGGCRATQNFVLVIDNSLSMASVRDDIDAFITRFVTETIDMDASDPDSPLVGVVTFNGGNGWTVQVHSSVASLPTPTACIYHPPPNVST